ncbi:hypothetical protein [Pandoraea sp. ISTKB]|uniref:hypothetical protein n=1 Tax=Pandoraea sp. ISTKB TaxID=1586708 RepID=UPI001112E380|nr:hypothetical protein [Pandoraea sp. ISTKB]
MISPDIPVGTPAPPPHFCHAHRAFGFIDMPVTCTSHLTRTKTEETLQFSHTLRIRRRLAFKAVYA